MLEDGTEGHSERSIVEYLPGQVGVVLRILTTVRHDAASIWPIRRLANAGLVVLPDSHYQPWRSAWEAIVVKRATILVVLTVAAAIGLTACASKTETASTAPPPPPPPAYMPPPPPEPYVAPPAPTRKYVSKRRQARKERRHARRHARRTATTTMTTAPAAAPAPAPAPGAPGSRTNVYGQPNQTFGIPGAGQASPSPTPPPSR